MMPRNFYQTGIWRYTVTNRASASQRISVIIRSQPRDPENPPIVARAFWAYPGIYSATPGAPNQRIHATVSKGAPGDRFESAY